VRHYVLTRSAYGPEWDLAANRRRLDITRAVTARLMAAQTTRDWAWMVLLDRSDPLLEERQAVFAGAAPKFIPILWTPPASPKAAPWDRHASSTTRVQRIAASAYKAPWRAALGERNERVLMTRLDDDDGLSTDALARYQAASHRVVKRTILMLPHGVRVWRGLYADVVHTHNAMHTLVTPPGDLGTVYDYGHAKCERAAPVVMVDDDWGWLWVRHRDTISGHRRGERVISPAVRAGFPVDWKALRMAWET
jgi:hypothetical protein